MRSRTPSFITRGKRMRTLTQKTQNGVPATQLATTPPNPMINKHEEWRDGIIAARSRHAFSHTLRRARFHTSAAASAGPSASVEGVERSTASDCVRASAARYRPGECPSAFLNMVIKAVTDS